MKRSALIGLFLLCSPLLMMAQSVWQGSCAVGSYGSFPSSGLYGASDSFKQNTLVTVENLENGKKATVLIIDRLNNNGLFLLLSRDAGSAIGLTSGDVTQVKVTLAKQLSPVAQGPGDLPYSPDSDVFPAASVGNPTSLGFLDQYLKKGKQIAPTEIAQPKTVGPHPEVSALAPQGVPKPSPQAPATPATPQQPEKPAAVAQEPVTPPPSQRQVSPQVAELKPAAAPSTTTPSLPVAATPAVPSQAGLPPTVTELQQPTIPPATPARLVAEALPLPEIRAPGPSVSEMASATPPPSQAPVSAVALPPEPQLKPLGAPQVNELAQAVPQAVTFTPTVSAVPPIFSVPVTAVKGPIVSALASVEPSRGAVEVAQAGLPLPSIAGLAPEITVLAARVPPAEIAPPVPAIPAPEVARKVTPQAPPPAPSTVPVHAESRITVLPARALRAAAYYLQLGAYYEQKAALALAGNLSPDYPVSVYAFANGTKPLFKVMIGPLNQDESGTLLYQFIDQGYQGAFVTKGK